MLYQYVYYGLYLLCVYILIWYIENGHSWIMLETETMH